jgi:hypothetical protein
MTCHPKMVRNLSQQQPHAEDSKTGAGGDAQNPFRSFHKPPATRVLDKSLHMAFMQPTNEY